jgi:hypothetical protein
LFSNDRFKSLAIKADCTQNGRRSVEVTVPVRKTAQVDFVKTHFRTIWPVHLSAFSKLLRHLRDAFDGDLDQLLVLAAIAERTPASRWAPEVEDLKKTRLVRVKGLEPPRLAAPEPKSGASTNSATPAIRRVL